MALLILALLQRIFLMSSLMLLLVWLIFFMVLIKLLPLLGTISGQTGKLMVLALVCLRHNRQDRHRPNCCGTAGCATGPLAPACGRRRGRYGTRRRGSPPPRAASVPPPGRAARSPSAPCGIPAPPGSRPRSAGRRECSR